MNFSSIRLRLTVWYLSVLLSALILLGAGVWIAVRYELYRSLDDSLSAGALGLSQFLERESDADDLVSILQEAREYTSGMPDGQRMRLFDSAGSVLLVFPSTEPAGAMRLKRTDITVRHHHLRLELSAPVRQIEDTLSTLRDVLLGSIPIVLLAAGFGGWWLSRKALQPVDRMTATVESISLHDLAVRLPVPATDDELERLGEAWNRMLDRLSVSVDKMSQFTADAAHELRTPIAIIRSTAELALRRERDAASYRAALATVGDEARNLSDLVADLLWLARNDAGSLKYNFESVSLAGLINDVGRSLEPLAAAKEVALETIVPVDDLFVRMDRNAIRRVLVILADNAIKFTRPGGTVEMRAWHEGDSCAVEVRDTGIGMDPADLPLIFDRFYQSDHSRNNSGFGLGLSIAKGIIEAHYGRIEVQSLSGSGSCFRVILPGNEAEQIHAHEAGSGRIAAQA